uniref:Subtilisin-like protease fibronectin type-III domain-containing protein n=1 Tax=Nelumbo nucifera TaxID=4432 RepID=A0A822Z616_NELNU|nr:TPA_asm: hypothetical protein HUJ06_014336 [Nelumbo nucifera]
MPTINAAPGVEITVEPLSLSFSSIGEKQSFTVSVKAKPKNDQSFTVSVKEKPKKHIFTVSVNISLVCDPMLVGDSLNSFQVSDTYLKKYAKPIMIILF